MSHDDLAMKRDMGIKEPGHQQVFLTQICTGSTEPRAFTCWIWDATLVVITGSTTQVPSHMFNSLTPGRFEWNFSYLIFQIISVIDGWGISCELALRWMSLDLTDNKSTLVQVMAWCCQATSHYLDQCWPRSPTPYGVTRPQRVNSVWPSDTIWRHRSESTLSSLQ